MDVQISVEYFGLIRQHVPDASESVSLAEGGTVRELFERLAERHGETLRVELLAPLGEPLPNVVLTVDGHRIADRSGMERAVRGGGVVRVLQLPPFIGGG